MAANLFLDMTLKEFEQYYKSLYMPLGMYALRLVDDIDDSRDIVQECFLSVWDRISAGTEISNFKAYMYMAVRNECLMRGRSKLRAVSLDEICDTLPVDKEAIDTSERDARLWTAIDSLPEKCRNVFLASKRDGLSNAEIAEQYGVSVKTVENQMTKAYKSLRMLLKPRPGGVVFLPFL